MLLENMARLASGTPPAQAILAQTPLVSAKRISQGAPADQLSDGALLTVVPFMSQTPTDPLPGWCQSKKSTSAVAVEVTGASQLPPRAPEDRPVQRRGAAEHGARRLNTTATSPVPEWCQSTSI